GAADVPIDVERAAERRDLVLAQPLEDPRDRVVRPARGAELGQPCAEGGADVVDCVPLLGRDGKCHPGPRPLLVVSGGVVTTWDHPTPSPRGKVKRSGGRLPGADGPSAERRVPGTRCPAARSVAV